MFEVSNFCFCCELETGGKIIGWFNAVVSVIGIISWGLIIGAYAAIKDDPNLQIDETTNAVLITISAIMIVYLLVVLIASVLLLQGINRRSHGRMTFFLVLMGIGVVLNIVQIFTVGTSGLATAILSAVLYAYFFVCIFSLYQKIKRENEGGSARPYA